MTASIQQPSRLTFRHLNLLCFILQNNNKEVSGAELIELGKLHPDKKIPESTIYSYLISLHGCGFLNRNQSKVNPNEVLYSVTPTGLKWIIEVGDLCRESTHSIALIPNC